ncbi:MAG: GTPase Era [Bacteroidetes bacterium]|nr:MAG: GTPase Era [Bacteroidota bacterium]TAE68137.1 MAG: GTPase Era [Bacteroidota bacterium]TAF95294.1 MAG: GTPase Era [Bacteroidota bacterium]
MKAGFVNIFGRPNAGKSTLLNALLQEKLAIVSPKVQTTRHRIKGFYTQPNEFQIVFSDTPGIMNPKYKLHERMMKYVKSALEDADVALLVVDIKDNWQELADLFASLALKVPSLVLINKCDTATAAKIQEAEAFFTSQPFANKVVCISALQTTDFSALLQQIVAFLPESEAFYNEDDLTDLPTKFFVGEMVREKIFDLLGDEIPYHSAVMVNEFKEQPEIIRIQADIIVQRETQKGIMLGQGGAMIKQIGSEARKNIEAFLGTKVFLQLFVKVRPKWRDNDHQLKEYGYGA